MAEADYPPTGERLLPPAPQIRGQVACSTPQQRIARRDGRAMRSNVYEASLTSAGFHVPSRMDGGFSLGQYNRIISTKASAGAGSQLASLSLPGESFWMY